MTGRARHKSVKQNQQMEKNGRLGQALIYTQKHSKVIYFLIIKHS